MTQGRLTSKGDDGLGGGGGHRLVTSGHTLPHDARDARGLCGEDRCQPVSWVAEAQDEVLQIEGKHRLLLYPLLLSIAPQMSTST